MGQRPSVISTTNQAYKGAEDQDAQYCKLPSTIFGFEQTLGIKSDLRYQPVLAMTVFFFVCVLNWMLQVEGNLEALEGRKCRRIDRSKCELLLSFEICLRFYFWPGSNFCIAFEGRRSWHSVHGEWLIF